VLVVWMMYKQVDATVVADGARRRAVDPLRWVVARRPVGAPVHQHCVGSSTETESKTHSAWRPRRTEHVAALIPATPIGLTGSFHRLIPRP
jgi:hypothetical protein